MTVLATNQSEMPPLLSHTALCVTLAGALGFIAVGLLMGLDLKGFAMLSIIANVVMAFVCLTACFAIVWCSPEGPDRGGRLSFHARLAKASSAVQRASSFLEVLPRRWSSISRKGQSLMRLGAPS